MGDKLIDSIVKATRISPDRVRDIIERAEDAFWADLVANSPGSRSGDLDPGAATAFTEACRNAAAAWLIANVQPTPTLGSAGYRVELRRPRDGERGWWIKDDSTPQAALREVLRECAEDPPGFPYNPAMLNRRDLDSDAVFDEEGMRLVTVISDVEIEVEPTSRESQQEAPKVGDVIEVTTDLPWAKSGERGVVTDITDGDMTLTFPDRLNNRVQGGIYSRHPSLRLVPKTPQEIWDGLKELP